MRPITANIAPVLATGLLLALAGEADAQDAPPGASACSGCHAPQGQLSLAQLSADDIAAAMLAYRDGTRDGTLMPRLARGFTDAEIAAIAIWLAEQAER